MHQDILNLIQTSRFCALATAEKEQPYCSLMAYAAEDDGTRIYMATHRNTQKFKNLLANPRASLLIDSRRAPDAQAVTLTGRVEQIPDVQNRSRARDLLLGRHPELQAFADHPDAVLIRFVPGFAVFLTGLTDVQHVDLEEP